MITVEKIRELERKAAKKRLARKKEKSEKEEENEQENKSFLADLFYKKKK
ncbi:MAG: hypothetical protein Unbinned8261contig1001_6 [Prokaryotic dsDNA virus sp.]|nr:MAG: hypothetical protein Unbinned8261contig1001_6 [Prokaryotic dsDNA virus sp.]|tara:strand:+ start:16134 stop:16283 length:150 start_codon:yes stop_codon:yes gene_type:complete